MIVGVRAAGERSRVSQHKRAASWEGDKRKKAWWALSDNVFHSSMYSTREHEETNQEANTIPAVEVEEEISRDGSEIDAQSERRASRDSKEAQTGQKRGPGLQKLGMESENEDEYDDLGSGSFDEEGMELAISAFQQRGQGGSSEEMAFDRSTVQWVGNDNALDEFEADEEKEASVQRLQLAKGEAAHGAFAMRPEEVEALRAATAESIVVAWLRDGSEPWSEDPA
mmetsp:Transcript_42925/g.86106  ORF Transcript_42925/g.86106 Transcript_42925/m.86106 type:complete len:226 (-) Transcript_42925:100-777(-)